MSGLKRGINPHVRDYDLRAERRADVEARARAVAVLLEQHPVMGGAFFGQVRAILFADDRVRRMRAENGAEGADPLDGVLQMWAQPPGRYAEVVREVWPGLADQLDDALAWRRASS